MSRQKVGLVTRWPLKGSILSSPRGLSGSSPLRSDGSHDSQMGCWASCLVVKDAQVRVGNSKLNVWGCYLQNKVVYLVSFNAIVI
jgi:hypothetical protein